ncbi:hypothetical protein [Modestobacter lapidis]|nr:hypothetical protein [Modestobacter lapidis]
MTTTRTLSQFVQTPTQVIADLEKGDVVLTRRGAASLRLSRADKVDGEAKAVSALAQLLGASLDDEVADRMVDNLGDAFPWIDFLPLEQRREFLKSFLRLARACASVNSFDRLGILLESWQATAAAYADPSVTADGSDLTYLDEPESVSDPRHA